MSMIEKKLTVAIIVFTVSLAVCGAALAAPAFSAPLQPGDEGEAVTVLQEELISRGLLDAATGTFDDATAAAVTALQQQLGVEPTGIYDEITHDALYGLPGDKPSEPTEPGTPNMPSEPPEDAATRSDLPAGEPADATQTALLSGISIGIDPGHQNTFDANLEPVSPDDSRTKPCMTTGTVGVRSGVNEQYINLQVSLRLCSLLQDAGADVTLSRTDGNVTLSNRDRALLMNSANVDVWVRVHCNSAASCQTNGAAVLVPARSANPEVYETSMLLGKCIYTSFCTTTGAKRLGVRTVATQTAFNWSDAPVITVELGYLSNTAEDMRLNRTDYQQLCAYGIYLGILDYAETVLCVQ